jgi:hypothetical protein
MASFTAGTSFSDGVANDVTAAKLGALVSNATPTSGLIQDRTAETVIATNDTFLIGDASDSNNLKRMTVANVMKAELTGNINATAGTITTLNSTTGTITGLSSTTGTIATLNSTTGTIPTLTAGTTTSTAANITNGTVQTLTASTATITTGTYSGLINSSTGTFSGEINSTTGTIATLNSTTGTIATSTSATSTVSSILTSKNVAINVTTLATATGTQNLDFTSQGYLTHSITGNITYTASNYAEGKSLTIRITSDGTARNLTFPTNWIFVGAKPTSIAASKVAALSVTSFGATEANTVAAYAVQT